MDEEPLSLMGYLDGLRRWWWLLLVVPLAMAGITAFVSANAPVQPLRYRATATILLQGSAGVNNFPRMATSRPALDAAIKESRLSVTIDELQAAVSARMVPGTDFLEIDAVHTQPSIATANANAVAEGLARYVEEIRESQFIATRAELSKQLANLETFTLSSDVAASLGRALEGSLASLTGIVILLPAETPVNPLPFAANHPVRNSGIALVLGFLLSILLAGFLDYVRNPSGSAAMFQQRYGLSHLGTVPRWTKKTGAEGELAVTSDAASGTVEAIRQAATNIEFGTRACGINSIVMASPDTGEGRSSLMANLAVAISSSWKKVVVVDADLRRPSLHGYFGLDNQAGLTSLSSDPDLNVGDVVQDTRYVGLRVITSGPPPSDPVALLKSPKMASLIKRLESEYDLVLVDTPPMAPLADGAVIASQVGATIMMVRPASANVVAVRLALGNLEKANARVLGFIWNRVPRGSITHYARYGKQRRSRAANPGGRTIGAQAPQIQ